MSFKTSEIVRSSFHGSLSCEMAEARLEASGLANSYLTRESNIRSGKFILSYASKKGEFKHIIIPSSSLQYRKFSTRYEIAQAIELLVSGIESCKQPVLPSLFKFDIENDDNDLDSDLDEELIKKEDINYSPRKLTKVNSRNHSEKRTNLLSKCYACGKEMKDYRALITHRRDGHFIRKCDICEKLLLNNQMFSHQQHHDEKVRIYNCSECDFSSKWNQTLKAHRKIHKNKLFCTQCHKSFIRERVYLEHKEKHSKDDYKCFFCALTYLDDSNRDRHMRDKHNYVKEKKIRVKPSCPVCDYVSSDKRRMESHLNRQHTVTVKKEKLQIEFKCEGKDCQYVSNRRRDYRRHTRTCSKLNQLIILF